MSSLQHVHVLNPSSTWASFHQTLLIGVSAALTIYGIWRGIYNVYFHPLRRFPGPWIASVSDFFKLWVISTKQVHTLTLAAHARYGPVVRVAPNVLSISDPRLLPAVYHRRVDKTDVYTPGVLGDTAPPFQTLPWREHARKRKRVAGSFALSNLVKLEGQVDERVVEWTTAISRRFADTGAKMDFAAWSQWFAYDTVSQLTFGEPLGFVREARDLSNLIKNFHDMAPFAAIVGALPWLCGPILRSPISKWLFMPRSGDSSGTGKIMAFRDNLLKTRLEDPQAQHKGDFLDNILNSKNEDGSPITLEEVKVECFILMVAGSDTTAALFCGFVRYVVQTPGVLDRLLAEIDDFDRRELLENPVPKFESIMKLRYFTACHREALRLHPPVPMILPRYVSEGGLDLYGKFAPAGAEIGANAYVTNRDKGIFGDDADEFRPERWLEDPQKEANMDKYILSWGYGARICLGRHIAQLETYKLLIQVGCPFLPLPRATLARSYDLSNDPSDRVQFFRLFKPSIVDPNNVWREANLALMVHWDMWLHIQHRSLADM
ncbi:cytochrome P450 monooxygenase [Biscogniauxia marginata]|nr:cytochrome P450 monooxygenase [Biscogniauxia marginata]